MKRALARRAAALAALIVGAPSAQAQSAFVIDPTTLVEVAVNGGTDTANPGTTCVKVVAPVDASCQAGYVALPNNNKLLIAAALQAKASSAPMRLYYVSGSTSFHCPGLVFTPCNAISLTVK